MTPHQNKDFTAYPDDLREQAFLIWLLEADRQGTRTAELLAEHEAQQASLDGVEPRKTPDFRTIYRWARNEDWDRRAQEYFATNAPDWYYRHMGRTLMQLDKGMYWMDLLLRPPGDAEAQAAFKDVKPEVLLQERMKALHANRETAGVGVVGLRFGRPDIPLPGGVSDGDQLTGLERAERNRRKALNTGGKKS